MTDSHSVAVEAPWIAAENPDCIIFSPLFDLHLFSTTALNMKNKDSMKLKKAHFFPHCMDKHLLAYQNIVPSQL